MELLIGLTIFGVSLGAALALPVLSFLRASRALQRADALTREVDALRAQVARLEQGRDASPTRPTAPDGRLGETSLPDVRDDGRDASPTRPAAADTLEQRIGARWLLYAGIGALILGVSYFIKFAFDNEWVSAPLRVLIGVAAGAGLVAAGWRFASRGLALFGHVLSGGGIVVLYISVYAALHVYGFIGAGTGFFAMVAITALAAWLAHLAARLAAGQAQAGAHALRQDAGHAAQVLGVLAVVGGFATPALVGGDRNAQLVLFTYVAVLLCGTLAMLVRHMWSVLPVVAYVMTGLTLLVWGDAHDTRAVWLRTELFLTLYLALFGAMLVVLRRSRIADRGSTRIADRESRIADRGSGIGDRESRIDADRGSGIGDPSIISSRDGEGRPSPSAGTASVDRRGTAPTAEALGTAHAADDPRSAIRDPRERPTPSLVILASWILATAPLVYHTASLAILDSLPGPLLVYLVLATVAGLSVTYHAGWRWARTIVLVLVGLPLISWMTALRMPGWYAGAVVTACAVYALHLAGQWRALSDDDGPARVPLSEIVHAHATGLFLPLALYLFFEDRFARWNAPLLTVAAIWNAAIAGMLRQRMPDLARQFVAIAATLAAVAIGEWFDGPVVAVGWAIEGAALGWAAARTRSQWLALGSAALLVLGSVRLLDVLSRPIAIGSLPILNSRALAAALVIGAVAWLAKQLREGATQVGGEAPRHALIIGGHILAIAWVSAEIGTIFGERAYQSSSSGLPSGAARAELAQQVALSLAWALYGVGLVALGFRRHYAPARYLAIGLFGLTIVKVLMKDIAELDRVYQMLSVLGVGALLVLASYLYQQMTRTPSDTPPHAPPGEPDGRLGEASLPDDGRARSPNAPNVAAADGHTIGIPPR